MGAPVKVTFMSQKRSVVSMISFIWLGATTHWKLGGASSSSSSSPSSFFFGLHLLRAAAMALMALAGWPSQPARGVAQRPVGLTFGGGRTYRIDTTASCQRLSVARAPQGRLTTPPAATESLD